MQIPIREGELVILDPAGNYYSGDRWEDIAFNYIEEEINNWLNYWKPDMGSDIYIRRVFSDYVDEKFESTGEYLAWMCSR